MASLLAPSEERRGLISVAPSEVQDGLGAPFDESSAEVGYDSEVAPSEVMQGYSELELELEKLVLLLAPGAC